jgi:hypothetical protein
MLLVTGTLAGRVPAVWAKATAAALTREFFLTLYFYLFLLIFFMFFLVCYFSLLLILSFWTWMLGIPSNYLPELDLIPHNSSHIWTTPKNIDK